MTEINYLHNELCRNENKYATIGRHCQYVSKSRNERPRVRALPAALLCVLEQEHYMIHPSLVLVQSMKTRLHIIERLLMGRKESNQNLQMFAWK